MIEQQLLDAIGEFLNYELFAINQTPVTLLSLVLFLVIILIFSLMSRLLQKFLKTKLLPKFNVDAGIQYTMTRVTHYLTIILGAFVAFQFVGINLSGLAFIFGFLSVGIGFGLQNITSNFVSGLILLFERPIKVGDRVTVGDVDGNVSEINIRSTTVQSLNNIAIIVPNSEFVSAKVINWSHGDPKVRLDINVGVSYGSNLDMVLKALREVANEYEHVLKSPPPKVLLHNFGDSSWDMQLRVWLMNPKDYYETRSGIHCAIVRKFREFNIEIPFPQRDLHLRSPLPLPHIATTEDPAMKVL